MGWPSTAVITSSDLSPASAAGDTPDPGPAPAGPPPTEAALHEALTDTGCLDAWLRHQNAFPDSCLADPAG